ncbi:MAG: coiled-coil domain-containing protein [Anaerolineae bacterium]
MSPLATTNPNVGWLDEELRKEKAIVAELRDAVDKQQVTIVDQTQRIMALEDRLAKLQAQLLRIPEVEEALRHTRDDMSVQLTEARQEQQKRENDFLRNRQAEREQDVRAIQNVQAEMARFDTLEQGMVVRQAEDRRLNEVILRVQQDGESVVKRLAQHEEVARQLAGRIDQVTTKAAPVEGLIADLQKATQEQLARVLRIETTISRLEVQQTDLSNLRQELTRKQDELTESQRRAERERSQTMTEWARKLEGLDQTLDGWADQLRYFADQHERNRRVLRDVQEMAQQVGQQQDQLKQVQRIAEEQLRREFREWRAENDRRWAQDTDRREKAAEAVTAREDTLEHRIEELGNQREDDLATVAKIEVRVAEHYETANAAMENLRRVQLHALRRQAKAFQDLLGELRGLLGEEGK